MNHWRRTYAGMALLLIAAGTSARTIELSASDIDRAAVISPEAPRLSWAAYGGRSRRDRPAVYSASAIQLTNEHTLLVRYDLSKLPRGMRITHAEWVLPLADHRPREARFAVHRIASAWGHGVCHDYRMTRPEPTPWSTPGAQSLGADRALRPTARIELTGASEELSINVTGDVELWYKGAAPNHGWVASVEDIGTFFRFDSPLWAGHHRWLLRITYEPE